MSISTLCRACSDSTGESLTSLPSISMLWSELQPVPAACRRALRVCLSWVGTAKWANPKLSRGLCNSLKAAAIYFSKFATLDTDYNP